MIAGIVAAITLIVAAIAVYTDVRWGKIFNAVTVPAMGVGLTLNAVVDGPAGLLMSVGGIAVGLGLFVISGFFIQHHIHMIFHHLTKNKKCAYNQYIILHCMSL